MIKEQSYSYSDISQYPKKVGLQKRLIQFKDFIKKKKKKEKNNGRISR